MPQSLVTLEILQPGARAEQLLDAIGAKLDAAGDPVGDGLVSFTLNTPDPAKARGDVEAALDEQGEWSHFLMIREP